MAFRRTFKAEITDRIEKQRQKLADVKQRAADMIAAEQGYLDGLLDALAMFESPQADDAVDPQVASTGNLSTRD